MTKLFILSFLAFHTFAFADINPVASGQNIQAAKINEVISKINELNDKIILLEKQVPAIGTIVSSFLTLSQYQKENGDCWKAIDGTLLGPTDELKTIAGYEQLPNASGRFLRNSGGNSAPVGSLQEDLIKEHSHTLRVTPNTTSTDYGQGGAYLTSSAQLSRIADPVTKYNQSFINNSGGAETRPINLSVNMFIKFRKQCNFN